MNALWFWNYVPSFQEEAHWRLREWGKELQRAEVIAALKGI